MLDSHLNHPDSALDGDATSACKAAASMAGGGTGDVVEAKAIPPLMRFLIPAFRLVDLHDSRRTPGTDMPSMPEDRPGLQEGIYCAIAWRVLEHLRDRETRGAFEFVDLPPFAKEIGGEMGVTAEDVLWVAQTLATPTEARWPGGMTRATAILRKLRRGHSYMLDRAGRELLAYVAGYFRWVHAGAEARKLISDLESGEMDSFREIAQRLLTKIRGELFDLRQLKEQPEVDLLHQSFLTHSDRFIKTFIEVSRVIGEAHRHRRRGRCPAQRSASSPPLRSHQGGRSDPGASRRPARPFLRSAVRADLRHHRRGRECGAAAIQCRTAGAGAGRVRPRRLATRQRRSANPPGWCGRAGGERLVHWGAHLDGRGHPRSRGAATAQRGDPFPHRAIDGQVRGLTGVDR